MKKRKEEEKEGEKTGNPYKGFVGARVA